VSAELVLGVLVSGSGTNLQAVIDAVASGRLRAKIGVVVSNLATAKALDRARAAGIPTVVVDHKAHSRREAFDGSVVEVLRAHGVSCVVLAGFMRIITPVLLEAFPHRVVNIHPSLLPAFPGVRAQAQALSYGVRVLQWLADDRVEILPGEAGGRTHVRVKGDPGDRVDGSR
jgi:phosphoribosylglycinamide formyltransferase-1